MKVQVLIFAVFMLAAAERIAATHHEMPDSKLNPVTAPVGSKDYGEHKIEYATDGDCDNDNLKRLFCTKAGGRYIYVDLGAVHRVTRVKIWGRNLDDARYLENMKNLQITVANNIEDLDNETSLCNYREGLATAGNTRPEVFNCTHTMSGQYVKVQMVNVENPHMVMCFAEMEIFGFPNTEPIRMTAAKPNTTEISKLIPVTAPVGSPAHGQFQIEYATDGDCAYNTTDKLFCTKTEGRYIYVDLGAVHGVTSVKIWGRNVDDERYLENMKNLKITVANNIEYMDEDFSLCNYREGLPAAGNTRPETFNCASTMYGQYVKVQMVDVENTLMAMCFAEMEIYGLPKTEPIRTVATKPPTPEITKLIPVTAVGSPDYGPFQLKYATDADSARDTSETLFCTNTGGRYIYADLGAVHPVTSVNIWGRNEDDEIFLENMRNLRITVANNIEYMDEDFALCNYREGLPTGGETRPEIFNCSNTMHGQYVKITMANVQNPHTPMCFAEIEIFGYPNIGPLGTVAAKPPTPVGNSGGCPSRFRCLNSCMIKHGSNNIRTAKCEDQRLCICKTMDWESLHL